MRCRECKDRMREQMTVAGREFTADLREHLDACPDCRAYAAELESLGDLLAPLDDIGLTADEAARLEGDLLASLPDEPAPIPVHPPEHRIFSLTRVLFAAAAVLLVMLISTNRTETPDVATDDGWDGLRLTQLDETDMASILFDSNVDLLPSLVDQSSAAYIYDQVQPGQVDDLFEGLSAEELSWLAENFTMEI